jgi:hypothetical protein
MIAAVNALHEPPPRGALADDVRRKFVVDFGLRFRLRLKLAGLDVVIFVVGEWCVYHT